ncbi:hypothetical protein FNF29_00792 [Cafeteria roenbergensis]|uniref:CBM20 domain-containing protein n=1 Tax=Cafeteria roenbergensis TaxID=33653 RepID=A0A5A8CY53_CAFRO|nr:hypothetical protein FNF29_00792 [Cafeteria roenbergensis]|eukprot:KAA0156681.1 hypothetical protein FNF29_00792 [Cafeteria roenbergensis]
MAAPATAFLTLQVSATVHMGEAVYLTGAAPSMGSWDLSSAVQLVTTPERFPVWYTPTPLPVPARKRVEYKYMIYSGGRFQRWENLDGNRVTAEAPDAGSTAAQPLDTLDVAPGAAAPGAAAATAAPGQAAGPSAIPAAAAPAPAQAAEPPQPLAAPASRSGSPATSPRISGPRSGHSATGPDGQSATGGDPGPGAHDHRRSRFELARNDGVIICCLRLPARVRRDASTGKWTASWDPEHLLARKRASFADALRVLYVGLAVADEAILPSDQAEVEAVLAQFHCCPVFVNPSTRRQFERGFCRDTLWGVMHNVVDVFGRRPTRWWTRDNQEDRWQAYSVVNQAFTDKVVQRYSEGDLVWAHGHHLLLMPQFIARRIRKATPSVGLFLHAPFPSSEIFRSLSCRQDLLRGMLLSGQLGFHLFEYARHFSTSCRRILSLHESDDAGERDRGHPGSQIIEYQGRNVSLTVSHAGIEPSVFARDVRSATARRESAQLRAILVDRDLDELARARRMMPHPPEEVCSRAVAAKAREVAQAADALSYGAISRSDDVPLMAAVLAALPASPGPAVALPVGPDGRHPAHDPRSRRAPAWGPLPRAAAARPAAAAAAGEGGASGAPLAGEACPAPDGAWQPAKEAAADPWADGKRRLAVGVETLSRLDAIPLKLCAWEALLRRCPHWVGRVALVQVCVADADAAEESDAVLSEARHIAARTNASYSVGSDGRSFPPVILIERSAPLPARSRAALFAAADVLVSLPLRAGFVSAPLEYVWAAAPEGRGAYSPAGVDPCLVQGPDGRLPLPAELDTLRGGRPGVAVLSEFMAGSRVLCGALRVNPWKTEEVVAAIAIALGMPGSERVARWESSASFVGNCSTADWAERVLTDLKRNASAVGRRAVVTMGLGYTYRNVNFGSKFRKLQTGNVLRAFRHSHRRVIFTDYGGTLHTRDVAEARRRALARGKLLGRDDAPPITPETFAALKQLSADPRTVVFVISGKERHVLDKAFEDLPDVGLAAEHGFFFRWPAKLSARAAAGQSGRWHRLISRFDDSWLDLALSIMELYTARTNGTFILRKGSAIAWHFGDADAEFGSMQAKELKDHLGGVMGTMPVEVVSGLNYIEVRPRDVHKGAIAIHVLSRLERVLGGAGDRSAFAPGDFGSASGGGALPSPAPASISGMSFPRKSTSRGLFGVNTGPAPSTPMSGGSTGTLGTLPIMDEGGRGDDAPAGHAMPAETSLGPPRASTLHHGQRVASAASRLATSVDSPSLPHAVAGGSGAAWGQDDSSLGNRGDAASRRPELYRGASDGSAWPGDATRPRGRSSASSTGFMVGERFFPQRGTNAPVAASSRDAPPPSPFVGAMSSSFLSGAAPMMSPHMGPQPTPLLGASTTQYRRSGPGSAGSSGCLDGADPGHISRARAAVSGSAGDQASAAGASAGAEVPAAAAGAGGDGQQGAPAGGGTAGRQAPSGRVIDFVLAAGDDTSDELMFTALNDWRRWGDGNGHHAVVARGLSEPPRSLEQPRADGAAGPTAPASRHAHLGHVEMARRAVSTQAGAPVGRGPGGARPAADATPAAKSSTHHRSVFTITVGQKPSRAHTFVDDTQAVEDLYTALARLSARSAPNRSMVDLRAAGTASRRGRPSVALHHSPQSPPLQHHTSPAGLDLGLGVGSDAAAAGAGPSLPGQMVLTAWPDRRVRSNSAASSESASSLHNAAVAGALLVSDRHAGSYTASGLALPASSPPAPNMDAADRSRSVVDMSLGLFTHSSAPHSGASTPMLPPLGRSSADQSPLLQSLRQHASTGATPFPDASSGGTGMPRDDAGARLGAGGAGMGSTAATPPEAPWDRPSSGSTTPVSSGMQWLSQVALTAGIGVPHSGQPSAAATPADADAAPGSRPGWASAPRHASAIARPASHVQMEDGRRRGHAAAMPRSLSGNIQSYFRSVEAQPEDEPMEF